MSSTYILSKVWGHIAPTVLGSYVGILVYGSRYCKLFTTLWTTLAILDSWNYLCHSFFSLDTLQLALFIFTQFEATVAHWGDPQLFTSDSLGDYFARLLTGHCIPTMVIVPVVQAYWLWRIWFLGKSMFPQRRVLKVLIFGSLVILVVSEFAAMTVAGLTEIIHAHRPPQMKLYMAIAISVMGLTDITITVVMTLVLYLNRTGFQKSNAFLKNLILYVLANGSLTTALLFALVALFLRNQDSWSWMGIFFVYERFYVSSLLASLNIRNSLQRGGKLGPLQVKISVDRAVSWENPVVLSHLIAWLRFAQHSLVFQTR